MNAAAKSDTLICLIPQWRDNAILDPFLPPKRLLNEMENIFMQKLRGRIWPVLIEMVKALAAVSHGNEEKAEREAAKFTPKELLHVMTGDIAWVRGGMLREQVRRHERKAVPKSPEVMNPGDSPRVEAVEDEEMVEPDYGIQEVSSKTGSPEEIEVVRPTVQQLFKTMDQNAILPSALTVVSLDKSVELPTPDASPATGKRKLPPSPEIKHVSHIAPTSAVPQAPILFRVDVSTKSPMSKHKSPDADLYISRDHVATTPPSGRTSNSTITTISSGPLPITPDNSDGRHPSDISDTLTDHNPANQQSPISDYTDDDPDTSSFTAPSDSPKPQLHLLMNPNRIPWIPAPTSDLGPHASHLLMGAWYDARARLRECRCSICARSKGKTFDGFVSVGAGRDAGKRLRIR